MTGPGRCDSRIRQSEEAALQREVGDFHLHQRDGFLLCIAFKKLAERLANPRVPSAQLTGHPDRYKIKLRSLGYHLVYEVQDSQMPVIVVAVGKRERNAVYLAAQKR